MNRSSKTKLVAAAARLNERYSASRAALYSPPLSAERNREWPSKSIITVLSVAALTACAHTTPSPEPVVRTVTVNVPVAVTCVPAQLAAAPDYPDTAAKLKAAQDAAERYQLVVAGRELRIARLGELEPVVAGCRTAAQGH